MLTNGGTVRARGTAIGAFTVALTYQDSDGNTRDGINAGERRIIIATISHTSGTLNTANLEGRIWIAVDNSSESSYYLSSVDDMTNPDSPLEPSDTLDTGNATLVEITSTNNEVVLKCATNPKNINKDKSYYIYTDLIPR